jgi:hypothetical protein
VHRRAVDAGDRHPGEHPGAERGRGAGQRHHQPGVIDELPVPEDDAAAPRPQPGHHPGGVRGRHAGRPRQRASAAGHRHPDGVPESPAQRGQRAHVPAGLVGHQEGQRPGEVRRRRPHQDGALAGALPGQAELAVGEVPEPAVHQLRRPPAGPGRQVGPLAQRHGEPPRGGVQRHARAGHPAADDQDVDAALGQDLQVRGPPGERQPAGPGHDVGGASGTGRL